MERYTSPLKAIVFAQFSSHGQINWSVSADKEKTHNKNTKCKKELLKFHFPTAQKWTLNVNRTICK